MLKPITKYYINCSGKQNLHGLFLIYRELSAQAFGPIVDLMFISLFIGSAGVTVMGYVSPLIMLFELVGSCLAAGARNKVSSLLGAGKIDEANSVFSASIVLGIGLSLTAALGIGIFCSGISLILGAREPQIFTMTKLYIFGYIIGLPFFHTYTNNLALFADAGAIQDS